jgi:hypothetical protein
MFFCKFSGHWTKFSYNRRSFSRGYADQLRVHPEQELFAPYIIWLELDLLRSNSAGVELAHTI